MGRSRFLLGATLVTVIAASPLNAQRLQDWQYRWYWGVKGGMVGYSLPTSGMAFTPTLGADWLITQRSVALYLGYMQSFTAEQDTFFVNNTSGQPVAFDGYRQLQINVLAFIGSKQLQPYVGGGFTLATLTNARDPNNSNNANLNAAISDAASGGFLQVMVGTQYRFGKKAALYAQYSFTPQGRDFLLAGAGHTIEGGLRYAFLSSREDDPRLRHRVR